MVSPSRRRDAAVYLCRRFNVSERRACKVVGQHRSTQRYQPQADDFEARLVREMNKIAGEYPRFGYRMVHSMLVDAGWAVNKKRIERLWRLEGHRVPPSRQTRPAGRASGADANAAWNLPATAPDHVWSYDFVSIRTVTGDPVRILNVVDEFTRECVGFHVAARIGAGEVRRVLERITAKRRPRVLRSDNGKEFVADSLKAWLAEQGITHAPVAKGSPQQNCYIERFNGTMRDQLLNGEEFDSVLEARVVIGQWVELYNTVRPHRALGMVPPAKFAAAWTPASPPPPSAKQPRRKPARQHDRRYRTASSGSSGEKTRSTRTSD